MADTFWSPKEKKNSEIEPCCQLCIGAKISGSWQKVIFSYLHPGLYFSAWCVNSKYLFLLFFFPQSVWVCLALLPAQVSVVNHLPPETLHLPSGWGGWGKGPAAVKSSTQLLSRRIVSMWGCWGWKCVGHKCHVSTAVHGSHPQGVFRVLL